MTREETIQILALLKTAYPGFYKGMSVKEANGAVALWHDMFADDAPALVAAAVMALFATDTKGFPPHIGAVKEKLRRLTMPEEMTEMEAWSLVQKAVRRGLYSSREEFDKLPPLLQRLVGSPNQLREWAMMDADIVQSVVASNFQRSFRVRAESHREYSLLPPDVRALVDGFAEGLSLDRALEGKREVEA